jgi:alpha-glucuronidase
MILALAAAVLSAVSNAAAAEAVIVCSARAGSVETLAAREVQRYVYLRTGALLPIAEKAADANAIMLAVDAGLKREQYRLKTSAQAGKKTLAITGGSPVAVLYGAYAFAEKLGVRFYLHGDVVPDEQSAFALPELDETRQPLFETRGIQPFHDFPEGPDWWDEDDYKCLAPVS